MNTRRIAEKIVEVINNEFNDMTTLEFLEEAFCVIEEMGELQFNLRLTGTSSVEAVALAGSLSHKLCEEMYRIQPEYAEDLISDVLDDAEQYLINLSDARLQYDYNLLNGLGGGLIWET